LGRQLFPGIGLELSIGFGRDTGRFRSTPLIVSGDYRSSRQIFDRSANGLVNNRDVGTYSDPVEHLNHVRRAHSDTSVARFSTQKCLLGRSMDIDASLKRAPVLLFGSSKPDYSAYDRIASGSVCRQDFAGRLAPVKDRSGRRGGTDLCCDLQTAKRSPPTSEIISFTVTGRRYLVGSIDLSVYYDGQLLVTDADDQFDLGFGSW